jgi:hypothetical protein
MKKLETIEYSDFGKFTTKEAGFEITRKSLPHPWDYIYTNERLLLRIRQDGAANLQLDPPGGSALFKFEKADPFPSFLVWLRPENKKTSFRMTNFGHLYREGTPSLQSEAEEFHCEYTPEAAQWTLKESGWEIETSLFLPHPEKPLLVMELAIGWQGKEEASIRVMPSLKPAMSPFATAPWDVPSLYQVGSYFKEGKMNGFWFESRDPGGDLAKRWRSGLLTDFPAKGFEVALQDFIGQGAWNLPEALETKKLSQLAGKPAYKINSIDKTHSVIGQPISGCLDTVLTFKPAQKKVYRFVFGLLPYTLGSATPKLSDFKEHKTYLAFDNCQKGLAARADKYHQLFQNHRFTSPDEALNRYVNEWLPLQLEWVGKLDRGWPTGMRGTRDSAQDTNAILYWHESEARSRFLELLQVQRTDGWFPRQYSTFGPEGKHDLRSYVDSGLWVWELGYDYLGQTGDYAILNESLRWLDAAKTASAGAHLFRILDYYLAEENIGSHGLCKIREGDWNDSINQAGLEGKGESVMVSCQFYMALRQALELLPLIPANLHAKYGIKEKSVYQQAAVKLQKNLMKHAFNQKGYFNGVFTDAGQWVFSPQDPDKRARINGPVNSFSIISEVAAPGNYKSILKALASLKGPYGWRLFYPAIGNPPIFKLGRIGTGNLAQGLCENGTPYNHGSQGFLGRAAAAAGKGDWLYEIFNYMLPYNPKAHPVKITKTAPYAVVNQYKEVMGQEGEGGDHFLSGSISTALRNIYHGMIGFRPTPAGLLLSPCVPSAWKELSAELSLRGARYLIHIHNPHHHQAGISSLKLDGKEITSAKELIKWGRKVAMISYEDLPSSGSHTLDITI